MAKNKIRDLLLHAIEASVKSEVPVLFISNPGLAKTTNVENWAKMKGYHVVTLIGSAYDRSELMGYMVNTGKDYLEIMKPNWFEEVEEYAKKDIPTVLFIDEISTAPIDVQGSLYRLIFNRCDGKGRTLPDNCVIVSAANYRWNLPPAFEVTAPSINRFCIVNIEADSMQSMLDEALQTVEERSEKLPTFKEIKDFNVSEKDILKIVHDKLGDLCKAYSSRSSSSGYLDPSNKHLSDLYDAMNAKDEHVLNFFSIRTIGMLVKMVTACARYSITSPSWIRAMSDGLIGAGTGNFEPKQLEKWRDIAEQTVKSIIVEIQARAGFTNSAKEESSLEEFFKDAETISQKVQALGLAFDSVKSLNAEQLNEKLLDIYTQITTSLPLTGDKAVNVLQASADNSKTAEERQVSIAEFKADIESVNTLIGLLSERKDLEALENVLYNLEKTYRFYEFYLKTAA